MTYFLEKATNYCAEHFHYFFFQVFSTSDEIPVWRW